MRKLVLVVGALVIAAEAHAATVVLSGGKRLDVASYTVSGSYVTVQYSNGRRESYPVTAVDLAATKAAAGEKAPAAQPTAEVGPHSPFLGAKATGKGGSLVVTDADVQHLEPNEGEEGEGDKKEEQADSGGQVVLVSYDRRAAGKGQWDVTATVANAGKTAVQGVSAMIRVLDPGGKPLASGSGTLGGKLEPGKQGTITARVAVEAEPAQVAVDLSWQEIKPVPTPAPAKQQPAVPAAAAAPKTGATMPSNPSPNSVAPNVMSPVSPNTLGTAPQAAPPQGSPKQS